MSLDRRQFIKVTAITGATAALAQCGSPENQIIRFIPEEDLVPAVATWKPSICPLCRAGCGVVVRVMEGDAEVFRNGQAGIIRMGLAKKLEGNPDDPVSRGKLCPRGQAAIQVTYHPDRIGRPLKRSGERGTGSFTEISWDEALAALGAALDKLAAAGDTASLAMVARPRGPHRTALVAQFLERLGAPPAVTFDVFSDEVLRRANAISFGSHALPVVDLSQTRYLLAFGADFLGTWHSPVAQSASYGLMRQGRPGVRGTFVMVEPRMSLTGATADEWVAIRPGTDGVLALGLAHVIMASGLRPASAAGRAGAVIEGWSSGLADYTPERVEARTGVSAARVERLARELVSHAPAIVLAGGTSLAHTNGVFHALASNALNALLGTVGQPGGLRVPEVAAAPRERRPLVDALRSAKVLLLDEANPVFAAPPAWTIASLLQDIPFIASFGSFVDETSAWADLILPDHSFLESWVDADAAPGAPGSARVAGPAMRPLHDTRAMPDVLLDVSRRLANPVTPPLPQSFEEMVAASSPASADQGPGTGRPEGRPLRTNSRGAAAPAAQDQTTPSRRYVEPQFDGDPGQYPFHFLPYASQSFLDGSLAHLPWLQEMPDPLTSAMWSSWVEINPHSAEKLGIHDGDIVEVASAHGAIRAPALLSPGTAPDALAMPVGQGHQSFTRYASGRGANPLAVLAALTDADTGALAWSATRVRVTRVGGSDGSLILFAGATRERPETHAGR
jgi:menaquinone reductase, molybdopterin-binding-like subunit